MADDTPRKAERGLRRARASLVERAAERLNASRSQPAEPAVTVHSKEAAATPSPAVEDGHAAAEVVARQASGPPDEAIVRSLQASSPATHDTATEEESETTPKRHRRARVTQIDCSILAARGLVTPGAKRNRTVEEFRLIKRVLLSRRWDIHDLPGNTIVVTSALPAEGKTTTAINLAMSIAAEEDVRVVLVDADFIKPDALRQLGVTANKGLIDVLQDSSLDISDILLRTDVDRLSLIPSGQLHERCTELLASARMDALIKELASRYEDRVLIFDSPPILATTESVALTSHMGQVVFVVQAGRTKRESVDSALELIGERSHVGLVLNRTTGGFGSTEFGAYYGSYYYGYGAKREQQAETAAE